ncbi:MAG: ATP-binding cassette domain-containing protein [Bryobacteraceae bacterium]
MCSRSWDLPAAARVLYSIMGALDAATEGSIALDERPYAGMNDTEQAAFRNEQIGFVFQDHSLLAQCSVLENVLVPTLIAKQPEPFEERARTLLKTVGLQDRLDHRPAQLSGGEKQRVAIARALIREPKLLLCDEPTGNLDRKSAETVGSMLLELAREQNAILVVATHSSELASTFPARYELIDKGLRKV